MSDKKIVINARCLTKSLTGIERYAYEVITRIPHTQLLSPKHLPSDYSALTSQHELIVNKLLGGHFWEQLVLPSMITKNSLLWAPGGLGAWAVRNQVLTIHDVVAIDHPEWYDSKFSLLYSSLWPKLAPRIRHIITDSSFSKERIISVLGVQEKRITVIPCGVSDHFFPRSENLVNETLRQLSLNTPYILSVSAISERKNFARLYEAWKLLYPRFPDLWLVVVGETGIASFKKTSIETPLPRTLYLGRVDDKVLPLLYSGAMAFVYPSLYEGFGFPPLEAMACGTPVVTSNVASIPEVVGDAALMVNPYKIDEIASAIQSVVEDSFLQKQLKNKGLERVKQFSWERTAKLTWDLLTKVAKE